MKKILVLAAAVMGATFCTNLSTINLPAQAEPIIELSAPRIQAPKVISGEGATIKPKRTTPTPSTTATTKNKAKTKSITKIKKRVHFKPKPILVNYDKVSQLIEYGYYDDADSILKGAINRNSKDIKAQALWAVSLAKQYKLDPAQSKLNVLLKEYPNNSNLHYAQGIVYFKRTTSSNMAYRNHSEQLLNDALKEFTKATDLDKTNAEAYNASGVTSLALGKPKDARDYFQKALNADNTYSTAIDNLGTMDYLDGKYSDAEKKYKQALVYNTQNTTAMYHLAQVAMQKQDYVSALTYLNNALAINPNSPAIYNLMGKAYRAQGNEPAAITAFKKSLAVKSEFALSYFDLAEIYEKRGDGEFAIEQLKTALTLDPDYNDAKLKIADISLSNGNYTQAIAYYAQLVGVDSYNVPALKGLANSYFGQAQVTSNRALLCSNKDLYTALDYINKAISANNAANVQDLELHLAKLKLTKMTNQPELSQAVLQKIIQSPNNDLTSAVTKGEAYLTLNDYKNAQNSFDTAIKLSTNPQNDLYLSEIFIYHKQYASAQKVLQKILKSDVQNQQALNDLGYIQKCKKYADNYFKSAQNFIKEKNLSAAMEYLSHSIAIDPNNPQAHLLLAQLYEKQKNNQDAIANYRAYLGLQPNIANTAYAKTIEKKIKKLNNRL